MQKLQCELCGSFDIFRTDDGFFQCQYCGCKYTLAQAKALLGTVETTIGTAELERLLKNAKTFLDIGKLDDSVKTYTEVTKQFPDDYRGWLGLLWVAYRKHPDYKFYSLSLDEMLEWHKICQKLAPSEKERAEIDREWTEYWDTGANLFRSGKLCNEFETRVDYFKDTSPAMYSYMKCGLENAKILNELHALYWGNQKQWVFGPRTMRKYVFWLGLALNTVDPNNPDDFSFGSAEMALPPIDDAYIAKIKSDIQKNMANDISNGRCPYCGGRIKGIFEKKCESCGKKY